MEEVFAKCHTKSDKSWVDSRAEKAYVSSVYLIYLHIFKHLE
jgi:hypothetical protein